MSARSAKRWGRWFAFVWVAMWLGTVLLPCCEVSAAVAAHEPAAYSDCGHSKGGAPESGGSPTHAPCASAAAPAPVPAHGLAAGGNPVPAIPAISSSPQAVSSIPGLPLPVATRAAPPPVAVYLRTLRLLI